VSKGCLPVIVHTPALAVNGDDRERADALVATT
jgi:hypothetical protein